jgi:hypothetical protein
MQQRSGTRRYHRRSWTYLTVQASRRMLRRGQSLLLGVLLGLACAVVALPATAVNLSFLGNSPISFFQPDDVDLMRKNAQQVLDSPQPNAKQTWSNPKTGASGFAQVTGVFTTADGTQCKRLRVFNKAGGVEGEATYPVCRYSDRGWVINADARPAN